jgi:hypothetical protein
MVLRQNGIDLLLQLDAERSRKAVELKSVREYSVPIAHQ